MSQLTTTEQAILQAAQSALIKSSSIVVHNNHQRDIADNSPLAYLLRRAQHTCETDLFPVSHSSLASGLSHW
jgi:hypothetical protein